MMEGQRRQMKISKITINNFKSIGESQNAIRLENGVTALIGKNESGKSNVLDAINAIRFKSSLQLKADDKNRVTKHDVSYLVALVASEQEAKNFGLCETEPLILTISQSGITYSGCGFSKLFDESTEIAILAKRFCEIIDRYKGYTETKKLHSALTSLENRIFLDAETIISASRTEIGRSGQVPKEFDETSKKFLSEKRRIYLLFPILYLYKEIQLQDSYTSTQISAMWEKGKEKDKSLETFLKAAKITVQQLWSATFELNAGQKDEAQDIIKSLVEENINKSFRKFYGQNSISVKVMFDGGNTIKINVISSDVRLRLTEQSNGLRWYLNFFLDMLARNLEDKAVLFLLDEPGVYLHVDAQAELLRLFEHLTKDKCSLIYTTHSPFMLNSNYPANIRVVQKINGLTAIANKYYSDEIDGSSKLETLSPLLKGIGASLSNTIFPLFDKPCLIVEGITDKLYIEAVLKAIKCEEPHFYIMPSISASKINQLVSIFLGWGITFKVLLDYDKAGFDEYKRLTHDPALCSDELIHFVNLENYQDGIAKDDYRTIESLIAESDIPKFEMLLRCKSGEVSKTIAANEFYSKVVNSDVELSQDTLSSFSKLFAALFSSSD